MLLVLASHPLPSADYRQVSGFSCTNASLLGYVVWPRTAAASRHVTCRTHGSEQPDYIIISTGLWHMLHIGDPEGYKSAMLQLGNLSDGLVNKQVRKHSTGWVNICC